MSKGRTQSPKCQKTREYTNVNVLTTSEFWDAMTIPGFVRLSLYQGQVGDTLYIVTEPPELSKGFMEGKIDSLRNLL